MHVETKALITTNEWSEEYEPEPEPKLEEHAGSLSVMVVNVGIQGS